VCVTRNSHWQLNFTVSHIVTQVLLYCSSPPQLPGMPPPAGTSMATTKTKATAGEATEAMKNAAGPAKTKAIKKRDEVDPGNVVTSRRIRVPSKKARDASPTKTCRPIVDEDDAAEDSSDNYITSPIPHHSSTSPDARNDNSDSDSVVLLQPQALKPKKKLGTSDEKPVVTSKFKFFWHILLFTSNIAEILFQIPHFMGDLKRNIVQEQSIALATVFEAVHAEVHCVIDCHDIDPSYWPELSYHFGKTKKPSYKFMTSKDWDVLKN
jgi:hypothetical protein